MRASPACAIFAFFARRAVFRVQKEFLAPREDFGGFYGASEVHRHDSDDVLKRFHVSRRVRGFFF